MRSLCLESNRTKYQLDLYYIFSDFVIDYRNENYGCRFFEVCDQLFNCIFLSANYEDSFLVRNLGLQILRLNIVLLMTVVFAILVFVKNLKKEVVGLVFFKFLFKETRILLFIFNYMPTFM